MPATTPTSRPERLQDRVPLAFLPTPLTRLTRLEASFAGPRLWIKRDDMTGLAFGGNKTRKLEYLVHDAIRQGCDTVITGGAAQSNHCRQTAAAAAAQGLSCHLVLGGQAPAQADGNLLLDHLLGATVHWAGEHRKGEDIPEIAAALREHGAHPYIIPYGGSDAVGALGFVEAMIELQTQLGARGESISHIVVASSSGGTHAGMLCGAAVTGLTCDIIGVGIDKDNRSSGPYASSIATLANALMDSLGRADRIDEGTVRIDDRFHEVGYGVIDTPEQHAIQRLAQAEGILLDPVYTARAFAVLSDMLDEGCFGTDDSVLFWHTGGQTALFPNRGCLNGEP